MSQVDTRRGRDYSKTRFSTKAERKTTDALRRVELATYESEDDSEIVDRQINIAGGGFRVVRKTLEDE